MRANTLKDFQKILKSLRPDIRGCLRWPKVSSEGYGRFKIQNRYTLAHRMVWEHMSGAIPAGLCIMHTCDIPSCVNIAHLSLGTWADNNRDRMRKGRSAIGERSGRAKLTETVVREIRALYAQDKYTLGELGTQFGVSDHQIFSVAHKHSWRHLV